MCSAYREALDATRADDVDDDRVYNAILRLATEAEGKKASDPDAWDEAEYLLHLAGHDWLTETLLVNNSAAIAARCTR